MNVRAGEGNVKVYACVCMHVAVCTPAFLCACMHECTCVCTRMHLTVCGPSTLVA